MENIRKFFTPLALRILEQDENDFYSVLAALRGPDGDQTRYIKKVFAFYVRRMILRGNMWWYPGMGYIVPPFVNKWDIDRLVNEAVRAGTHYLEHIRIALKAIGRVLTKRDMSYVWLLWRVANVLYNCVGGLITEEQAKADIWREIAFYMKNNKINAYEIYKRRYGSYGSDCNDDWIEEEEEDWDWEDEEEEWDDEWYEEEW